jgi:hypothetical protein
MEKTFTDPGQRVGTEWSQGDVVSPGRSASEGRAATIGEDLAEAPGRFSARSSRAR